MYVLEDGVDCRGVSFHKQNGTNHCRGLANGSVMNGEEILSLAKFSSGMKLGSENPIRFHIASRPSLPDYPCWGVAQSMDSIL